MSGGAVVLSTAQLGGDPGSALDLIFTQKTFLNFSIVCHLERLRIFKFIKSWLFLVCLPVLLLNLSLSSWILLQATRRNQAALSTLCLKISLARSLSSLGTFSTFHIAAGNNVVKFCHYIRSLSFHFPWYVSHFPETSPEALLKFRFLLCVQVNLACFRIYTSKFFPVFTNWLVRKPLHIFRYLLQYHSTDGTKIYVRYLLLYNTLTQI